MTEQPDAFYTLEDDVFVGQIAARGPWSLDHCHAGPVTGALGRAVENCVGMEKQVVRLTIELLKPVPLNGFRISVERVGETRRLATCTAKLTDLEGNTCATARSMHIAAEDLGAVPTASAKSLNRAEATPGPFPIPQSIHGQPSFKDFAEIAYPPGETRDPGPTTLWMKTLPLIRGETPSPFQRLCPLADCGNGTSRNANPQDMGFINPDITLVAHRLPESEWLAIEARSDWNSSGIGLSTAVLYDESGPCASVLQSLVLRRP